MKEAATHRAMQAGKEGQRIVPPGILTREITVGASSAITFLMRLPPGRTLLLSRKIQKLSMEVGREQWLTTERNLLG